MLQRRVRPAPPVAAIAAAALICAVVLGLVIVAGFYLLGGGRWFVVSTPSMGTAAPVGTLVLTEPVSVESLRVGSIISFHPPTAPSETYTHRVVRVSPDGGVATKGDINGADDPWTVHQADLVGVVTTVVPGLGWLVRALPILIVGMTVVEVISRLMRGAQLRAATRMVGASVVFAAAGAVLRPFANAQVLRTYSSGSGIGLDVVSTGLLPVRVSVGASHYVDLLSGQVGHLLIPGSESPDHYRIGTMLHLGPTEWVVIVLLCCSPLIMTMVFGLPPNSAQRR